MATYAITEKHYKIIGIAALIIGIVMLASNSFGLIKELGALPKEITSDGNHLFHARSAGKYTIKTYGGGSATSTKTRYSIYYISSNGLYELYEELPEGTAILQSQLANKSTRRTVFVFDSGYFVGSAEDMTVEAGLTEMKKVIRDAKLPLIIIGAAATVMGIWFQFVAKSRRRTGPVETISV